MANPRYNTQVTQPRGGSARVGKMGGGMMRPMYKKGGVVSESKKKQFRKNKEGQKDFNKKIIGKGKKFIKDTLEGKFADPKRGTAEPRIGKMAGGRIAGAARRAQEHGYYTPDMGMKGGRMYRDGGKVKKPKVKKIAIGIGKAKDYPGIKKIIEMNKKGKKRFKDGGSALKAVDKSKNPGLAKLPTQVRNKMGYMKKGGRVHKNTRRMNRLEELGRVDAEKGFTRKGKRNLRAEKKRIVRELKK
jgi:hypothetical protein